MSLKAPFPWFGYEWIGHTQLRGCRPTILPVLLLVVHRIRCRASVNDCAMRSANSDRCSARCSALVISFRFSAESFNLLRSLWWTTKPLGIGPCSFSHTNFARRIHVLGSPILINARFSPLRLWRVLTFTEPTSHLFSLGIPSMNLPFESLIESSISSIYYGGN